MSRTMLPHKIHSSISATEAKRLASTLSCCCRPKQPLRAVVKDDRIVFLGGKDGQHSLAISVSGKDRILAHWAGYCENNGCKSGSCAAGAPYARHLLGGGGAKHVPVETHTTGSFAVDDFKVKIRYPIKIRKDKIYAVLDKFKPGGDVNAVSRALAKLGACFAPWSDGSPGNYSTPRHPVYK